MRIPYGAIADAKKLKQGKPGNILFGDSYFAMDCEKRWGKEVFRKACEQVKYIPMDNLR